MRKIRVLVVDDSALMRKIISDIINSEEDMEVIDTARNGEEFLKKLENSNIDVVTLDVEMPKMDGVTALKEIKRNKINIPVIVLSSASKRSAEITMQCLEAGAIDFLSKPSGSISLDINKVKDELVEKIRTVTSKDFKMKNSEVRSFDYGNSTKSSDFRRSNIEKVNTDKVNIDKVNIDKVNTTLSNRVKRSIGQKIEVIVIGASTGGPKALYEVITALRGDINVPVLVVQHMPIGFTKAFAERLNNNSQLKVVEASQGESIEKNTVYVAPAGQHMEVKSDGKISLNNEPTIWGVRPAVDKLFISASRVYGAKIVSVVLTGMGKDGAEGTIQVKNEGGYTISEDQSTCIIYGMPKVAFETGKVDEVIPLDKIASRLIRLIEGTEN